MCLKFEKRILWKSENAISLMLLPAHEDLVAHSLPFRVSFYASVRSTFPNTAEPTMAIWHEKGHATLVHLNEWTDVV